MSKKKIKQKLISYKNAPGSAVLALHPAFGFLKEKAMIGLPADRAFYIIYFD